MTVTVKLEGWEVDEQWSYVSAKSNQRWCWYTDDWGAYSHHLDADQHGLGKRNTQEIERKNLSLRKWIKRLIPKTICFPKLEVMHDVAIGLLINKVELGKKYLLMIAPPPAANTPTPSESICGELV